MKNYCVEKLAVHFNYEDTFSTNPDQKIRSEIRIKNGVKRGVIVNPSGINLKIERSKGDY